MASAPSLRGLLRLLPCQPSEAPRFRAAVLSAARAAQTDQGRCPPDDPLLREAEFLLRAQKRLHDLNERYFPQSGMSPQEVVESTAARVGFRLPKQADPDGGSGN